MITKNDQQTTTTIGFLILQLVVFERLFRSHKISLTLAQKMSLTWAHNICRTPSLDSKKFISSRPITFVKSPVQVKDYAGPGFLRINGEVFLVGWLTGWLVDTKLVLNIGGILTLSVLPLAYWEHPPNILWVLQNTFNSTSVTDDCLGPIGKFSVNHIRDFYDHHKTCFRGLRCSTVEPFSRKTSSSYQMYNRYQVLRTKKVYRKGFHDSKSDSQILKPSTKNKPVPWYEASE
ncbi:hypothetical protein M0802_012226 [Mischocyttarus mexicanus]|nr:hypothetical protein M0802_012226 [Mischocyttarus mexicanus]